MSKQTEALKLALEALNKSQPIDSSSVIPHNAHCKAITAIREALAEQFCDNHCTWLDHHPECDKAEQPAQQRHISYVCPQCHWSLDKQQAQQQWVGLTDEERRSIREWQRIQEELGPVWAPMMLYLYEAIEAKLKEKNT